jgi:hypothetical protein
MSKHIAQAFDMLIAARPASGFRPETQAEWLKLLKAYEELGYAAYRMTGLSDTAARQLARSTHGGSRGMQLLDIAYRDVKS